MGDTLNRLDCKKMTTLCNFMEDRREGIDGAVDAYQVADLATGTLGFLVTPNNVKGVAKRYNIKLKRKPPERKPQTLSRSEQLEARVAILERYLQRTLREGGEFDILADMCDELGNLNAEAQADNHPRQSTQDPGQPEERDRRSGPDGEAAAA